MEILTYRVSSNPIQRALSYRYKRYPNPSTKLLKMHNQLLLTANYGKGAVAKYLEYWESVLEHTVPAFACNYGSLLWGYCAFL